MKWQILTVWLVSNSLLVAADTHIAAPAQIERGKYLVESLGMCADCHSPHLFSGEIDRGHWLEGSPLAFKAKYRVVPFATVAPPIAGLPNYASDAAAVKFLETGTNAAGKLAMAPMPQFRMNHEDATAVVAYLRSLKK